MKRCTSSSLRGAASVSPAADEGALNRLAIRPTRSSVARAAASGAHGAGALENFGDSAIAVDHDQKTTQRDQAGCACAP